MTTTHRVTCIQCPLACQVEITTDDAGELIEVEGYQCKQGKKYALQELKAPTRVLTATVRTEGSLRRLLPVRTQKPIPKDMLRECMPILARIRVKPVLTIGEVITPNILGTGVDVVCSDDLRQ